MPKKRETRVLFATRLPKALDRALKAFSERTGRSIQHVVESAVREYLGKHG